MDSDARLRLLEQLSRTEGEAAQRAVEKEISKIAEILASELEYENIELQLRFLKAIAFRKADDAIAIVSKILSRIDDKELTHRKYPGISDERLKRYQNKETLIASAISIASDLRYLALTQAFDLAASYLEREPEVAKAARSCLLSIAKWSIPVYFGTTRVAGIGAQPQLKMLALIEERGPNFWSKECALLCEISECILDPTAEAHSADWQSVTWSTAALPARPDIVEARDRTLKILFKLFDLPATDKEKILSSMVAATRTPSNASFGRDLQELVTKNTIDLLDSWQARLSEQSLFVTQKIEHHAYWIWHHGTSEVKVTALKIRDVIGANAEYAIYRDLIGFEGVFGNWESEDEQSNFEARNDYREEKAKQYAASIDEKNYEEWKDRISLYASTNSRDLATFPIFGLFLETLATISPKISLRLSEDSPDVFHRFFVPVLHGLWKSDRKSARALLLKNVKSNELVAQSARFFTFIRPESDLELLKSILSVAQKASNVTALIHVAVISMRWSDIQSDLRPFFSKALEALTALKNFAWVDEIWFRKNIKSWIEALSEGEREAILQNFILMPDVDYRAEELLTALAVRNPIRIINFFGDRLEIERKQTSSPLDKSYDAIPYRFHKLQIPLSKEPKAAVDIVRSWYDGNYGLFIYRGANFLHVIFPDFPPIFAAELIRLVKTGERENLEFTLAVLRTFDGEPTLREVCREIIKALPDDSDLLLEVEVALENTGVVRGEYGAAESYKRKKEESSPWLTDVDDKVRLFAIKYHRNLDAMIEAEIKRANEDIQLRKWNYGEKDE